MSTALPATDRSRARRLARALEHGANVPGFGALAAMWGALASVARPLVLPPRARVLTIGGATLGGSGKTPLAIACAQFLAREGARVAFVGHAHRARVVAPRVVAAGDASAGDEAAEAALALGSLVPVVVGPSRQAAVDFAAQRADVLVIDGPLGCAPKPPALALLAVDGVRPFGSGACPPCGDLRAPIAQLRRVADAVVAVGPTSNHEVADCHARWSPTVVRSAGKPDLRLAALAGTSVRVATAVARPDRFLAVLNGAGVRVATHVEVADHADLTLEPGAWLVPRKNAPRARFRRRDPSNALAWLEYDIVLPASLRDLLRFRLLERGSAVSSTRSGTSGLAL
jgi:tetraacyldisaccharide 4'-kinase